MHSELCLSALVSSSDVPNPPILLPFLTRALSSPSGCSRLLHRDISPVLLCLVLCCLLSPPCWPLSFTSTQPCTQTARLPLNISQSLSRLQTLQKPPGRALSFNNIYHSPRCDETPPSHSWQSCKDRWPWGLGVTPKPTAAVPVSLLGLQQEVSSTQKRSTMPGGLASDSCVSQCRSLGKQMALC